MQDSDYQVMKSLAKILIRKGVITRDEIHDEVDELERTSQSKAAHSLTIIALEAEAMTASQFEADYRRRQMVERTAYLEKQRKPDDGKPPA